MRTFGDLHIGDVLINLWYDATENSFTHTLIIVTNIRSHALIYQILNNRGIDFGLQIENWNDTYIEDSYYDSSDRSIICADIEVAREYLETQRREFLQMIDNELESL